MIFSRERSIFCQQRKTYMYEVFFLKLWGFNWHFRLESSKKLNSLTGYLNNNKLNRVRADFLNIFHFSCKWHFLSRFLIKKFEDWSEEEHWRTWTWNSEWTDIKIRLYLIKVSNGMEVVSELTVTDSGSVDWRVKPATIPLNRYPSSFFKRTKFQNFPNWFVRQFSFLCHQRFSFYFGNIVAFQSTQVVIFWCQTDGKFYDQKKIGFSFHSSPPTQQF